MTAWALLTLALRAPQTLPRSSSDVVRTHLTKPLAAAPDAHCQPLSSTSLLKSTRNLRVRDLPGCRRQAGSRWHSRRPAPTGSQLEGRATPEASQTTGCAGVVCHLMKVKSGVALFICWVNNFEDFLSKTSFGGVAQVWTLSVFSEESCVSL